MLKRLTEFEKMEVTDKGHILSVIEGVIKSIKLPNIALYKSKSLGFPRLIISFKDIRISSTELTFCESTRISVRNSVYFI